MNPSIIILTIAAYIALLFITAYLSGRKADNAGFFVGNRQSSLFMVTFAMIGAAMSGVTFVSVPGMVISNGFSYFQMALGFVVGQLVVAFVLIPLFYRMQLVSIYQYLEDRFGVNAHRTGAWFFFISKLLGASVRLFLICAVMQLLVFGPYGLPFWLNAVITMSLVLFYTFQGGVKSLIWTDSLKTMCLIVSIVLSIWFTATQMDKSWSTLWSEIWNSEHSRIFFLDDANDKRYFFKQFFAGVFALIAMTGLDQDLMQRNLSCKNYRDSQKNIVISSILQTIIIFMFLCLGVILYMFSQQMGIELPEGSDHMFPTVATSSSMPVIVGIMFTLGLISSTYSAAGSALTALTTSFTIDILDGENKYQNEKLTSVRKRVHILMAVAMFAVVMAIHQLNSSSVIDAVYTLASYTYGPILGMFAFGILTRRKIRDRWVGPVAIISPLICFILQQNSEAWFGGYKFSYELLIVNACVTFLGLCLLIRKR